MNDRINLLAVIMTATLSMAVGAALMYVKNKEALDFASKYPEIMETQDYMKDTGRGLPETPDVDVQVNAFLSLYDDKYTYYQKSDVHSTESVKSSINDSPTAFGCGFKVEFDSEGLLYFSELDPDKSWASQGVQVGDTILAIDEIEPEKVDDYLGLKGKDGTAVVLRLKNKSGIREVKLKRVSDKDKALGLDWEKFGNTLCVHYTEIGDSSNERFREIVTCESFDSLIIDLRDNPGGSVAVAMNSADIFIDRSEVKLKEYSGVVENYYTSDGVEVDVPIVVLINGNTASSAEIMTGLLKQYADTVIVGETSFGKGVFQNYGTFHGGVLKYTAGEVFVGSWPCYQGVGIAPDIEVEMDPDLIGTDEDIQLQKALEILG